MDPCRLVQPFSGIGAKCQRAQRSQEGEKIGFLWGDRFNGFADGSRFGLV